jgi:hypothetical protein
VVRWLQWLVSRLGYTGRLSRLFRAVLWGARSLSARRGAAARRRVRAAGSAPRVRARAAPPRQHAHHQATGHAAVAGPARSGTRRPGDPPTPRPPPRRRPRPPAPLRPRPRRRPPAPAPQLRTSPSHAGCGGLFAATAAASSSRPLLPAASPFFPRHLEPACMRTRAGAATRAGVLAGEPKAERKEGSGPAEAAAPGRHVPGHRRGPGGG